MSVRLSTAGPALLIIAWLLLVVTGTTHRWWLPPVKEGAEPDVFIQEVHNILDRRMNGNVAFLLLEDGHIIYEHYDSLGEEIAPDTLFQLASISKWVTAWGVFTLVEAGRLDLDAPVGEYLTRWTLPPGPHDPRGVTARRLLSHTAGLADRLGYLGFTDPEEVQSLEEALSHPADAAESAAAGSTSSAGVEVGRAPGSRFQYSGGGYALLQLVIEEITGQPFNSYMREAVLRPLGMDHASFELNEGVQADLALHYNRDGTPTPHRSFAAPATSSLHATPHEMARFLLAHRTGPRGEPPGRGILSPSTIDQMLSPEASIFGIDVWALGPALFGFNDEGRGIIGHDGQNAPGISTTARIDPATGDGLIVFSSGDPELAQVIGTEWVYWKTGVIDLPALARHASAIGVLAAAGIGVIGAMWIILRRFQKRK